MKKVIGLVLAVLMLATVSTAVTLKIIQPEGSVTMTRPTGQEITLKDATNTIRWWKVISGGVNIVQNKFTMPGTNVEVEAQYTGNQILVIQGENGNISPETTVVSEGGSQTFSITPNSGYLISSVLVDGENKGAISSYTFSDVQENHVITATYREISDSDLYTVTWKNDNGDVLETDTSVLYGTTPKYDGAEPTKAATAQYSYTFTGWSPAITAVTEDVIYTAQYSSTVNKYTVIWKNGDTVLETDNNVEFGATPKYDGAEPTKAATAEYTYTFSGWSPVISTVSGDITYIAQFGTTGNTYTVRWVDEDGTELEVDNNVAYGATPTFNGTNPTKAATAQYTYTFTGWSPAISSVSGNVTYTAQYSSTVNTYTVKWVNEDGTELEVDNNVAYGTTPTFNGTNPTKAATAQYTYTFNGWTPAISSVSGDVTYTATYTSTVNQYTVTAMAGAGGTITPASATVDYGGSATFTIAPNDGYVLSELKVNGSTVPATSPYTITDVTSNQTITAIFREFTIADIPVGAYIKYTPGTNITTSYTGGTYTPNSSYASGWKVFKNNNGQLDIISAESVGNLELSGENGYRNAVYILNTLSEGYVNTTYATDGRSLGSTADWTETTVNSSKSLGKITSIIESGVSGFSYTDELYASDVAIIDTSVNGTFPLRDKSGWIWLASRVNGYNGGTDFEVRLRSYTDADKGNINGADGSTLLYRTYNDGWGTRKKSYGVRPIISLKSGLKIESGDELTIDTAYVLSN